MRVKALNDTICLKCGKTIKKGRMISHDGWCYRCDENRILRLLHIEEWREKRRIKHLKEVRSGI